MPVTSMRVFLVKFLIPNTVYVIPTLSKLRGGHFSTLFICTTLELRVLLVSVSARHVSPPPGNRQLPRKFSADRNFLNGSCDK